MVLLLRSLCRGACAGSRAAEEGQGRRGRASSWEEAARREDLKGGPGEVISGGGLTD